MSIAKRSFIALYGPIQILKAYCGDCDGTVFVIKGNLACCGKPFVDEQDITHRRSKRISECEQAKRGPSLAVRTMILKLQEGRCFYCDQLFGLRRYGRSMKLHWDHKVPYAYSQNNTTDNFVAACATCNMWKGALMFDTIEQARVYLAGKWEHQIREYKRKHEDEEDEN